MDRDVNPLVLLLGIILLSIVSSVLSDVELIILLFLTLTLPFFFGINSLKILFKLKIILFTALLIFVFGYIEKRETLSILADTARFLSLVLLSLLFIEKADLIELSTTIGKILSILFGSFGWKLSSSLMMSIVVFPLVFECGDEMILARKSRGYSFMHNPVKGLTEYTVSLMRLLFDKLVAFQDALLSRSFSIKKERTSYPLGRKNILLIVLFISLFIGVIVWKKIL